MFSYFVELPNTKFFALLGPLSSLLVSVLIAVKSVQVKVLLVSATPEV